MKTLKNYNKFLESLLPEPEVNEIKKIKFLVPVKVEKELNDDGRIFSYSTIRDIENSLSNDGFESDWLSEQFERWKDFKSEELNPGEEPKLNEYDNVDDYDDEYKEWEEMNSRYIDFINSEDSDLIEEYANEEFGSWNRFIEEFKLEDQITILDTREQKEIFDILKDDFNGENMIEYFEDFELSSMEIVGNNFEDGYFILEVGTIEDLSDEKIKVLKDWIEGQMSDGWGEGFEQEEINGFSVSPWWNEDETSLPNYEIKVEK